MNNSCFLIVDDHELYRRGLCLLLRDAHPGTALHEAGSIEQALALDRVIPELVLLDIKLPGLGGIDGIAVLKQRWPDVVVVMLTSLETPEAAAEAIGSGASGYISKSESADVIRGRIAIALGQGDSSSCCAEPGCIHLTPRQREVLGYLGQGLSNKHIASRMALSENTVRRHVQDILGYFGAARRSEAVFAAQRRGLMP